MNVAPQLAFDLLNAFARAEFALKGIRRLCIGNEGNNASANWDRFASDIAIQLATAFGLLPETKKILLIDPPMKEVVRGGVAVFEHMPLQGPEGVQLLSAVRRVRNNLFHGGRRGPSAMPAMTRS
ncbi:hypothetical protein [Tahibacter amnicola]|uniref:Uncharacterized protein n=1 Tax=Tahibacter amnicola TaxID=2976241 RepID=A0ABY6B806_9GAMM|nr:hypothetical protein [Tahibacter amnicola]UXI66015.1 hypothetical protein N4264_14775 [Tahibacter amnicola]